MNYSEFIMSATVSDLRTFFVLRLKNQEKEMKNVQVNSPAIILIDCTRGVPTN